MWTAGGLCASEVALNKIAAKVLRSPLQALACLIVGQKALQFSGVHKRGLYEALHALRALVAQKATVRGDEM